MNETELRRGLAEVAAEAPDISELQTAQLIRRIERRRGLRVAATACSVTALSLVLATGLYLGEPYLGRDNSLSADQPSSSGNRPGESTLRIGECGEKVTGEPQNTPPVEMTASIPRTATRDARGMLPFDVTVTNHTERAIYGITSMSPRVYVTSNRVVLAGPQGVRAAGLVINLAPGESMTFRTAADFSPCGSLPGSEPILGAGTYELFAHLRIRYIDGNHSLTGETLDVYGGPWVVSVT